MLVLPKKGLEFIIEKPEVVYKDEDFDIIVGVQNYDNQPHVIKLWSYVYRGSKVYSGTREGNLIIITITPNSSEEIKLENTVEADPGTYKLKIKINKDDQKNQ